MRSESVQDLKKSERIALTTTSRVILGPLRSESAWTFSRSGFVMRVLS